MSSDADIKSLVRRVQQGDRQAPGELIDATQGLLFKFCFLLSRNREVAEDLCQEALIKAFQGIHQLQKPETFLGWLYQIAKNLFIDYTRSAAYRKNVSDEVLAEFEAGSDMEAVALVQEILAHFEPEEQFLLLLVELGGCSYKEAGERTGLSEDAVRSRLHRLRQAFIEKVQARGKR